MATDVIDLSSLDTQADDTQSTQTVDTTTDATQEIQQGNQESQQAEVLSGRAVREAIRSMSEAHPEQAKILRQLADSHFRDGAWKQAFPNVQEATAAKKIIEGAGGLEGISQAQTRLQTYDQQDAALKEGNPEVLDAMFKDFPEGAAALAPHYLDKLAKANPDAFSAAIAPHAIGMLERAGVGDYLAALASETDPARQKVIAQQLADWFKGQSSNVAQMKNHQPDPRADKLKEQETKLNEERETLFKEGVSTQVNSKVTSPTTAMVDKYAQQYKLNPTQKDHYAKTLIQVVQQEMEADKTYQQQRDLRYQNKQRSHESVASFIASEFNQRIKDRAFDVAKSIYGAPRTQAAAEPGTGVPKAGQPQTAPGGGPLRISARPADSQLDLSRPNADLLLIKGQGYLKDGRFVSWR